MADFINEKIDVYDYIKSCNKPVAIYGMGNGADKLFNIFEKKGIDIAGVFASDDFVRGQSFRGYVVKKYDDIKKELGEMIVVPAFATQISEVMAHIDDIDSDSELLFPELPVFGDQPMDMHYIEENLAELTKTYDLLYDDFSREVFSGLINFRISGKLSYLRKITTPREEVFSAMGVTGNEVYADIGAYDGDTIREFYALNGGIMRTIAVEPDRRNYRKLENFAATWDDITIINKAAYDKACELSFNDKAGRNSALDEQGRRTVYADKLDSIFSENGFNDVSYIKYDVEGAEREALLGSKETLKAKPKLCVSAYHRINDLTELPKLILELNPDYRIMIRKHPYYPGWETAFYCF